MRRIVNVSYDFIKNHPLFDKEAERVYKMYPSQYIKIFTLEEKNKSVAICIIYDGPTYKALFHFHSKNIKHLNLFIEFFESLHPNEFDIYLPKEYDEKYYKLITKQKFSFIDNVHSYVFVPSLSMNLSFWKDFYSKKEHKVIKYFVENGCDRCSFEKTNDEKYRNMDLLEKLNQRIMNDEFDDPYNPFIKNDFDPKYSYIAYFNDKPVAYLTVKNINGILLLDHLSLSKEATHNGLSLLLISKFINNVIDDYKEHPEKYFEVRTKAIRESSTMFNLLDESLNKIIFQEREKILYRLNDSSLKINKKENS